MHDARLMIAGGLVCAVGIYASFAIGHHAARATGRARTRWGLVSIIASGSTAWATHFIVLLSFKPGMPAAFEPALTAISLTCAIIGIGAGVSISIRARQRWQQFVAGLIVGIGVATLHYIGQAAYLVQGTVAWNLGLVVPSVILSLPISGLAMMAVGSRNRHIRLAAAPLLLLSIAVLHFCGMAAMTLDFDPAVKFPESAVSPLAITPVVAGVSLALIVLAVFGWRFDLAAKARLRQDRQRLRELADVALEGLLICQDDVIVTANDSIEFLSGHEPGSLSGLFASSLLPGLDVSGMPEREEREVNLISAEGKNVPVRVLRREVTLGHKIQTVIAVRDQRERLQTEAKMRLLAFTDSLTGLANRTRFFDLLALHTASRRERDRPCAVLMLDLDRFKAVNDTLGHTAGDIVLGMVADRLRSTLRGEDIIARLGGDEFAILQLATDENDAAFALATRIKEIIAARPFMLEGQAIHLGASVGIALAPDDGHDPAELMRNADLALYAAKASGRGTFRRYDISLDEQMRERRSIETGLRLALAEGQLELHYQPLADAKTGNITSAEALVRWNHPERGLVSPTDFIGIAEETGLIVPLGEWVIRTACAEAATWPETMSVAINLSPAQFRDRSLVSNIVEALQANHLAPERLELEVTEGVLLSDETGTLETLNQLRKLGVRVSMDDFGTGYSSLSYLRKFPFDKIKIDQSFVRQVPHDEESSAIVRAIITMAKCLGMSTTVEGVETTEQFDFSVAAGCDTIQGYLIGRPLDRTGLASLIATRGKAAHLPAAA
ncbi:EAL domain-containing protein [Sphingomonas sp. PL-96]|uniref:bifunctional diguanylate cyclase/phosphodiesterase n=1 Tax=Sphingomonas sp. PL-96 TaxID=2887201 RepID=UPI001E2FD009|nr:EAL domain-containing protein [Sphingomonas sp. PL-96]MCC2976633.1 EAL domain-containing protein [Sphingomonas sp. PL-96]